ncbi:sorting nexin-7-like isoform X1 [Amphibalanus amphitrite]|uniref:sorting nexin-7-like isoform X2 n=1 Tax=Amphibalanus amphitrite TaxID=1232801 RepID=UPI001C903ADD|nr:sorting nexin-7-like isoform X2 [Amphibalanus amphitrite]XP_043241891.1 sorting nexin-7-like isoform X2 [Amphibalanus amphitrite]XP_043241899.1 sorting nexin-7-like isoform X2 [Amphibalanus amphitrite]XP_043241905.1 sorting nexin-7-like isoform X2 [Amphibalanus amphitrite]XP_043241913.1 sorting nexin-7-like isoform X2 [Amphibalanus amphitrite]XP_043243305.1 sorting nexin-7-like isoform X1 [Amphibalanus amphitrite]XP_043243306.1 sorting nexin-7-like isoform X1 [Amphibalanus amphitrite]XP_0
MASPTMATLDVTQEAAVKPSVLNLADESSMIDEVNNSQYIATPSVASVSWDDLDPTDTRDLQIKVDDPQKHVTSMETYITFRISTKTSRAEFDDSEYSVRRRYNEFLWLRARLTEAYPTHIVPPLPEKHSLLGQLDRYQRDFIRSRMALLHRFMNRVADHPVLSCNDSFKLFLVSKPSEFAVHRSRGRSVLNRVSESLHGLTTAGVQSRSPEIQRVLDYAEKLSDKLTALEKASSRIHKDKTVMIGEMQRLHPTLTLMSASEPELGPLLRAAAGAVSRCAAAEQAVTDAQPAQLEQPLREYVLYAEAIREALGRRDAVQAQFEATAAEIQRKEAERAQVNAGHAPSGLSWVFSRATPEALKAEEEKLGKQLHQLKVDLESLNDRLECANSNLLADMERWEKLKVRDISQLLGAMGDSQINFYEECLASWESALAVSEMTLDPSRDRPSAN